MPRYRIKPGHTYRDRDGAVRGPGDEIELDSDVAAVAPHSVELLPEGAATDAPAEAAPDADVQAG